jgi:hypothetical protein
VTQSGLLTARQMTIATAVTVALAVVPGLYLVWLGGPDCGRAALRAPPTAATRHPALRS